MRVHRDSLRDVFEPLTCLNNPEATLDVSVSVAFAKAYGLSFCVYKAAFSSACSHSAACSRDDAQSKKQVWPTGPQLLWKRVQSMLFCMLFHRLAFVFAEEALCVVFTPLPLSSTSESTERC